MLKYFKRLNHSIHSDEGQSDLHTLLLSLDPEHSFEERADTLKQIMKWLRQPVLSSGPGATLEGMDARNVRLRFLLQMIERHQDISQDFMATFQEIIGKGRATRLYCLSGIPENNGFLSELTDRIIQNILPPVHREKDLAEIFKFIFTEDDDAQWFESCPQQIIKPFLELLKKGKISTDGLYQDQSDALIILGAQISALGISKQIRPHLEFEQISEISFIKLAMTINRHAPKNAISAEIMASRDCLFVIRRNMENSGVSVDLIHHLEKMESLLNRIEMILSLQKEEGKEVNIFAVSDFIGHLINEELTGLRVKDFLRQNLHLLTRKIVERAGDKGDPYIAHTKEERRGLFFAASGAGILTATTAVIKYWIGAWNFPLFFEGLFFFFNYAISFLLMQKWHLALSSKQPAYTASALSKKFESFMQTKELAEIIQEVRIVIRSQFIAAFANLLWVIPVVFLIDMLWYWPKGVHIVNSQDAYEIINKHGLWNSFSLLFAAFTGVLLWLSSVVSGWTENWLVFRNIPLMLKESTVLKKVLGKQSTDHLADKFPSTMAGVSGNLSIAFFMASPIIIGKITGLPLDIRHVTLSAGSVTLALSSLSLGIENWPVYLEMLLSIICIGTLNFGVSFYCALRMAALARNVDPRYLKVIFKFSLLKSRPRSSE